MNELSLECDLLGWCWMLFEAGFDLSKVLWRECRHRGGTVDLMKVKAPPELVVKVLSSYRRTNGKVLFSEGSGEGAGKGRSVQESPRQGWSRASVSFCVYSPIANKLEGK
jgi:hypothetical protein